MQLFTNMKPGPGKRILIVFFVIILLIAVIFLPLQLGRLIAPQESTPWAVGLISIFGIVVVGFGLYVLLHWIIKGKGPDFLIH